MDYKASVCVTLVCLLAKAYGNYLEDYCWRDFGGSIPFDALVAGVDNTGKPIYIGQTLVHNQFIPGRLFEDTNNIQLYAVNETVKILCTENPKNFEWLKTRIDTVGNIKNKRVFEVGYGKGYTTYVARVTTNGEKMIRQVTCSIDGCNKVFAMNDGIWDHHEEFEILTYNESMTKKGSASGSSDYKAKVTKKLPFFISFFLIIITRVLTY